MWRRVDGDYQDQDISLLSLPPEEDWVLHGPYADRSLMRNAVAYTLAASLSLPYTPRHRFIELFLSRKRPVLAEAKYRGVYLLVEKIKRGNARVDISETGFLIEQTSEDKLEKRENTFPLAHGGHISVKYPRPEDVTPEQMATIKKHIAAVEQTLFDDNLDDAKDLFDAQVDMGSFVDFVILNEFFRNRDAFFASTFFTLEPGGSLKAGPVWDFNISSGHDEEEGNADTSGWQYARWPGWGGRLLRSSRLREAVAARWDELRRDPFGDQRLVAIVSRFRAELGEAQVRNFCRWDEVLGQYVWRSKVPYETSFEEATNRLSNWLVERAHWLDKNIHLTE